MKTKLTSLFIAFLFISACSKNDNNLIKDFKVNDCIFVYYGEIPSDPWIKPVQDVHLITEIGKDSFKTFSFPYVTQSVLESYVTFDSLKSNKIKKSDCPPILASYLPKETKYEKKYYNLDYVQSYDSNFIKIDSVPEKYKSFAENYNNIISNYLHEKEYLKQNLTNFKQKQKEQKDSLKSEYRKFADNIYAQRKLVNENKIKHLKFFFISLNIPEQDIYLQEIENLSNGYIFANMEESKKRLKFLSYFKEIPEFLKKYETLKNILEKKS